MSTCARPIWAINGREMIEKRNSAVILEVDTAGLAQLAARRSHNPKVVSSILTPRIGVESVSLPIKFSHRTFGLRKTVLAHVPARV